MRWPFKLIVPLWVFTCFVAFGQSHLVIDTGEYHYSATFDPARISKEKLRELLVFSPYDFGEDGWKLGQQQINTSMSTTRQKLQKEAIPISLELREWARDHTYQEVSTESSSRKKHYGPTRA